MGDKSYKSFDSGKKLVPSAGTAVQLPNLSIPRGEKVTIKAISTNAGIVYIANSKSGAEDKINCYPLTSDDDVALQISNLNLVWLNADNNNEGVNWIVVL